MIADGLDLVALKRDFDSSNLPFRFLIVDNFLTQESYQNLISNFPVGNFTSEYKQGYLGQNKREFNPNALEPSVLSLVAKFNSPDFLRFLEKVTGIDGLVPDPYFLGGGFHEILMDGRLGMHTDFRVHEKLKLTRRLNILIYLNEEWNERWKGALRLENPDKKLLREIFPLGNRLVIMETNESSWHGHPEPLDVPQGVTRRSLALYYYTADHDVLAPNLNTMYRITDGLAKDRLSVTLNNFLQIFFKELVPPILTRFLVGTKRKLMGGRRN